MSNSIFDGAMDIMRDAGIEPRESQVSLLKYLSEPGARFVQAPTGVGKSFAVIAHAAANAEETGDHSIIIAADNTLLDQYASKDLPAMAKSGRYEYAVIKGRRHYACASANNEDNPQYRQMLKAALAAPRLRGSELARPSEEIGHCNGADRCHSCAGEGVCFRKCGLPDCGGEYCSNDGCCTHENGICWSKRARLLTFEADLVLTNTSMWLVNAALYDQTEGMIRLIPFGQPYVDEAQQLPQTVRDSLGWKLTKESGRGLGKELTKELQTFLVEVVIAGYVTPYIPAAAAPGIAPPANRPPAPARPAAPLTPAG